MEHRYQMLMFEQFCAALMYEIQLFAIDFDKPEGSPEFLALERQSYPFSPLGATPIMLPQLINVEGLFDTSHRRAKLSRLPSALSNNQATSVPVKLWGISNSDRLLIDAIEFMNAIYEDMTQINEIISIKMIQALVPEGVALFYKGYLIVNTLEPRYLSKVILKCKLHRLFEQGSVPRQAQAEILLDLFTFRTFQRRAKAEQAYRYVSLMEEMVQKNYMDRFEDQKRSMGEKGYLDDSTSSEDSDKDPAEKGKGSDKSDDDEDDSEYGSESEEDKDKDGEANEKGKGAKKSKRRLTKK